MSAPLFPLRGAPVPAEQGWRAGRSTDFSRLNVLVVDDAPMHRMLLCAALDFLGIGAVTEAAGGRSGLAALEQSSQVFDIVLCESNMADMDGIEFMRLAPRHKMNSLVFISGCESELRAAFAVLDRRDGIAMRGVLDKPIALPQLKILLGGPA